MDSREFLNEEKKELLALLLAEEGLSTSQEQQIKPAGREEFLPLSFAQQRLWILDRLAPGNPIYNIPTAVRLRGQLNRAMFEQSLNEIIRRHEALRTIFTEVEGEPAQIILPNLSLALPLVDLEKLSASEREAEVQQLMIEEARLPFDLARGPLVRTTLLRLGAEEHIWLLTMHHIISDGWSIGVFMQEMSVLYDAFSQGKPSPLPEPPLQYADYALWQRKWLTGTILEEQLAYWKQRLSEAPPVLEIRTDHPRPAVQTFRGKRLPYVLPKSLSERLKTLSRREETTLFMTLLSAFKVLLSRYSGQEDIVVGTPIAGRNRSEIENLIGYFLNTLVLRTNLSADTSFRELLQQVRKVTLDAYAHQDVPFEKILQELQLERTLSHTPLFQIFFNMLNFDDSEIALPGLKAEYLPPCEVTSKFDITLYAEERQDDIFLELVYNTDLFEQERMVEMLEQFNFLLWQIVEKPGEKIAHFSLVTPTAQAFLPDPRQLLNADWLGPIHAQCSRQAQRAPERAAIVDPHGIWSYRELDIYSNQLANYLREGGCKPGDIVAIYGYRSAALVCAVLGVLKAGAAFCILDPAYPATRLVDYLELVNPRAWLQIAEAGTSPDLLQTYLKVSSCHCYLELFSDLVSMAESPLSGYSRDNPGVTISPNDIAYISFTSGSTGKPKGVLGRHGPLTHFFPWQAQMYGFHEEDRYSMLSGLSHDPLQREIFTPLWFGATICIPLPEDIGMPGRLAAWMSQNRISITHITPAMIQMLTQSTLSTTAISKIPSLRYAFIMSDVVSRHDVSSMRKIAPAVTCVNSYGATETQRAVANYVIPHEVGSAGQSIQEKERVKEIIPVGRGIRDAQLLVLHHGLQPAGVGEVGEIYIRSPHLAEGYLNDDALTQERFIVNPFTNIAGDRLYKTGDRGCYLPDGNVEVLGRNDSQVKIRGFRIELGEIEASLRTHPAVKECLVMVREDIPGDKRLVAYIIPDREQSIASFSLHSFLKEKLPDYMIPSSYVFLEKLPLTPNGKVDRQALPPADQARPELKDPFVAARTPVEEVLVTIWSQILNVSNVGIHDNFFELGGHSLLATQVISRIRDSFQVELPLRSLFEAPTVADLARYIEASFQGVQDQQAGIIERVPQDKDIPLSFAQQRLWFLDQLEPGNPFYNLHAAVHLSGALHKTALERSLNEIVRRHEILRTNFVAIDGRARQVIAPPTYIPLELMDLRGQRTREERDAIALRLAMQEAERPFDMVRGPLMRSKILQLANEEYVLLLTLHHIISDGWSVGIFVKELASLYDAFTNGKSSPLPELPIQYADYAAWQRRWLDGAVLENQLAYWKQQLQGAPPVLELPIDRPRPAIQTFRGARLALGLPGQMLNQLKALGRQEGVTLFMILLAAFKLLLARYSGQEDIVVGTPIAGRNRSEMEALIGFFVNTLVLRTNLAENPTFSQLLNRVREVCLEAYVHQDLPFERLVEAIQPERDLSHNPLFQVMFVLQDASMENLELAGLTLSALNVENRSARFDLVLSLAETSEGLDGHIEYNTDLFDDTTIARMKGHFETLLESIVAEPKQNIRNISLLTSEEQQKILVEWNATQADYPRDRCMHHLFESQVERTPSTLAVLFEQEQLTYQELNQRANQLAHHLQASGVGPEVRVGICMERSLEMVVALLGVLKAGGVYVPLDPAYPSDRLSFMLNDAGISILLTQHQHLRNLSQQEQVSQILCLDSSSEILSRQPIENPGSSAGSDNLAYIIYTSGSTGTPKGVMIAHQGLVNYLYWCSRSYPVAEGQGSPVHSPLAFDLTITSLLLPLLVGRSVFLLPNQPAIETLNAALRSGNNFSLIKITPAHLALLSQQLEPQENVNCVKAFIIGGEQLLAEHVARWQAIAPDTVLVNEYGPTETVVGCCVYQVSARQQTSGPIPIGRPIANTRLYLLDHYMQPVPPGLPGELYIGSDGLARGYLNRPELTAASFVPDPFSMQQGARLYKTGDLARYLTDGNLEFLGRNDNQVKLRGYRIELGEIEGVLGQLAEVKTAAVCIREDHPGDKRLIAYIVPQQGYLPDVNTLHNYLKGKLPDYMVPANFVLLDDLPLTTNGKLDNRALPAPDSSKHESKTGYILPQTAMERTIAAIWQEVLHVEKVGLYDNFFDLGGHSLLLIQIHSKLEQAFHAGLSVVELFQYPTIHSLAMHINQKSITGPSIEQSDARSAQLEAGKNRLKQRLGRKLQVTTH